MSVGLPRNAGVDQLMQLLAAQVGSDFSQAARQSAVITIPDAPVVIFVRQTPQHWLFSTDQATLDGLLTGEDTFGTSRIATVMQRQKFSAHACYAIDYQQMVQVAQTYAPMLMMGMDDNEERQVLRQFLATLPQIIPHVPVGYSAIGKDADHTYYYDENGTFILGFMAGLTLPAVNGARATARHMEFGHNLKQLFVLSLVYSMDHGSYPHSMQQVMDANKDDVRPDMLIHPQARGVEPSFVYVRPTNNARASQIVMLENPAIQDYQKAATVYGDGSLQLDPISVLETEFPGISYESLWQVALDLSQSEAARTKGIQSRRLASGSG